MTALGRRQPMGLGRGLEALIPRGASDASSAEVPLHLIVANTYQPREQMDQQQLAQLAASITEHGVLQPVLLRETAEGYEVVAGERRVRAARLAGLERIPAVVRHMEDRDRLALALVENLQRSDLNSLEEALAFRRLIDQFSLTQEEVATSVGRSRSAVANTLRLLDLSSAGQDAVRAGKITEGHARALLTVRRAANQDELLAVVIARSLSVRQTEQLARRLNETSLSAASGTPERAPDPDLERVEADLRHALGTKVTLSTTRRGGRITIEYYDGEDLERLCRQLTASPA
ncbi:ParB/RepB/Spo0J family partition protein [soil metagenome]